MPTLPIVKEERSKSDQGMMIESPPSLPKITKKIMPSIILFYFQLLVRFNISLLIHIHVNFIQISSLYNIIIVLYSKH